MATPGIFSGTDPIDEINIGARSWYSSRPRVLLFPIPLWSPQLVSPLAAPPLQGAPLPPCDLEREISIFPALNAASSDGSLLFLQSDRAWHFLEAEPAACLGLAGDRSVGSL